MSGSGFKFGYTLTCDPSLNSLQTIKIIKIVKFIIKAEATWNCSWSLYLFKLDLGIDMDIADLAVEGFVLKAGTLGGGGIAVLQLGSGPRVSLDWPCTASGFQHSLVLWTCEESSHLSFKETGRFFCAHRDISNHDLIIMEKTRLTNVSSKVVLQYKFLI